MAGGIGCGRRRAGYWNPAHYKECGGGWAVLLLGWPRDKCATEGEGGVCPARPDSGLRRNDGKGGGMVGGRMRMAGSRCGNAGVGVNGGVKIGVWDWKKLGLENPLTSGRASPTILFYRLDAPLSWGGRPATAQGRADARQRRSATAVGGLTTE